MQYLRNLRWLVICLFFTILLVPLTFYAFYENDAQPPKVKPPNDSRADVFDMEIKLYRHGTDKVEMVNAYDYICGVVAAEMPADYQPEALKAQAVAAFTYTVNKMELTVSDPELDTGHNGGYVCDDYNHCKAYIPPAEAVRKVGANGFKKISDAVYDTLGTVITYDGSPINAVFHSICCGNTASAAQVWGSEVPYLQSVECKSDTKAKNYKTTVSFSKKEFSDKMYAEIGVTMPEDISSWLGGITRFDSGYVDKVTLGGTQYAGTFIRKLFSLRSAAFDIEIKDENVVFTVLGYGHGAGLSQSGAESMAKDGYDHKEILQKFYTGVVIQDYKIPE